MSEALVILSAAVSEAERTAIAKLAPPRQWISERVFVVESSPTLLAQLRATPGVGQILTGSESPGSLPTLNQAEALFAGAWLTNRQQVKQRPGDGLDWDTPPMTPPDRKLPK